MSVKRLDEKHRIMPSRSQLREILSAKGGGLKPPL